MVWDLPENFVFEHPTIHFAPPKHSQPHYDCLGVGGKNLSTLGQKVGFRKFQTTQRVNLGPTLHKGLDLTSQGCKNSFSQIRFTI